MVDETLMKQIVEAVLNQLQTQEGEPACTEGLEKLLVVGDLASVPSEMAGNYILLPVEDYVQHRNIHRYGKLLITRLNLTQLSDIANGRDASPEACAVIMALLNGMEVFITGTALPHRQYAGKSSSRLYEVIENNARMLQSFGIKLLKPAPAAPVPAKPPKYQAPAVETPVGTACINGDRLITEAAARSLTANGEKTVCLAANAIVTPSAWDVFKQKGVTVSRQS